MPTALVTGCSSGFGLLTAIELARAGFRVYATLRDLARRQRLDEAARAAAVALDVMTLDVSDAAAVTRVVAEVERSGPIDVLVNNAGFGIGGFIHDVELDEYRLQFETNFFGVVATTRAVLPGMLRRRAGRIINVSSIGGRVAMPGLSAYNASKFAVEGFTESLRIEAAPFDVWAVLVEPGTFRTDIFGRNRREARRMRDPASPYHAAVAAFDQMLDDILASSKDDPRNVAHAIVKAATARRPTLRYVVGAGARLEMLLKSLLPWSKWERMVLRATGFAKALGR